MGEINSIIIYQIGIFTELKRSDKRPKKLTVKLKLLLYKFIAFVLKSGIFYYTKF